MRIKLRRDSRCEARDPRNCLDITCFERNRFFPVPRDHAVNDHRTAGWYPQESLQRKEIGDPIPGASDYHLTPEENAELERILLASSITSIHAGLLNLVYEAREAERGWAGEEAYVIQALDAPGYRQVPANLNLEELTEAELLAGIKLGYMARPQPWVNRLPVDERAAHSFLRKLLFATQQTG